VYNVFEVKTGGVGETSNILFCENEYIGMDDGIYRFEKDFVFVEDEGKHHVIDVKTKKSIYVSDYGIDSFSIDKSDFPIEKMTVKHSRIRVFEYSKLLY